MTTKPVRPDNLFKNKCKPIQAKNYFKLALRSMKGIYYPNHIYRKNAKYRYDLEFNVTFKPILSLNVTRSSLINRGFVTK